ncbi:MAG: hypothetical protein IJ113_08180 [Eggerthellaceae bacterium]|nr:hypothetical protein [Eggerthellaceae bacterium]
MYHPESTDQIRRRQQSWVRIIVIVAIAIVLGTLAFIGARDAVREQGALSMRTAILEHAKQCCAVEGAYPKSINYLVDHYGLVINDKDYVISYECYADNVVPSVAVVPK